MARREPKIRRQASGQWRITIAGKDHYLGHDEAEALRESRILLGRHAAGELVNPAKSSNTVGGLILQYLTHLEVYYKSNPKSTDRAKRSLKKLNSLYGTRKPEVIDMQAVKSIRASFLGEKEPMCRREINRAMGEITRFWKWCCEEELASGEIAARFIALSPLKAGRCDARETVPVGVAPQESVDAVIKALGGAVGAMIQVQQLSGARPGEICALKASDIDRTGPVWKAVLVKHKMAHKGKTRVLFFGPKAQEIIRPFLLRSGVDGYLFNSGDRKSTPGPKRPPLTPYSIVSYDSTVANCCKRLGVTHWSPNQLRHSRATALRAGHGIEAASAVLGHSSLTTTQIYAEESLKLAESIAAAEG